ncbi:hypothetical protein BBP40_006426 [Aspergillus hancockii]|nr:hypothetical protein BBP40_006426 [Aspergillus hancockii]
MDELPTGTAAGLSNGGNVGIVIVIGGFLDGHLSTKFGYKRVLLAALFCMNWFVFILFFAPSAPVPLVGQIPCGFTWGIFATTSPAYASEVCPLALRGYLTCYANLCWAIRQFIASGALYGLLNIKNEWSSRMVYARQWIWPVPLFLLILFAPESPWWLARNNRTDDVYKFLARHDTRGCESHQGTLAQAMHTLELEKTMESGSSYLDCFRGIDRRRTEIICVRFAGQVLSGSAFAYTFNLFHCAGGNQYRKRLSDLGRGHGDFLRRNSHLLVLAGTVRPMPTIRDRHHLFDLFLGDHRSHRRSV